jgi:hypothetical protein
VSDATPATADVVPIQNKLGTALAHRGNTGFTMAHAAPKAIQVRKRSRKYNEAKINVVLLFISSWYIRMSFLPSIIMAADDCKKLS